MYYLFGVRILKQLTFGIGEGYSHSFNSNYAPSLSTDSIPKLNLQKLTATNFVISSMLIFKFTKLKLTAGSTKFHLADKPIPNGKEFFNALDEKNNDLFYTKKVSGISVKVVFSIGNK